MKTGHVMCPLTTDQGSGITGHGSLRKSGAMAGRRPAPWICAQVASAYDPRNSRTYPDEIIEALIKRKNEGKLDTPLNTQIRTEVYGLHSVHIRHTLHM